MFNGAIITTRVLFGAAAVFAVIGITAVAYGTASNPMPISEAPTPAVISAPTPSAAAVAANTDDLEQTEAEGILFMREEEKLARDVYLTLADIWDVRIFANIARAEQTHMDAVLGLMDNHGLQDPVAGNDIGVFVNSDLQQMYNELVALGSESLESALKVGALIEEVDIEDLVIYLEATIPGDVATVYERLLSGSENHLRAFTSQLESAGIAYEPAVLEADVYQAIISSDIKRGGHSSDNQQDGHQSDRGRGRGAGRGGRNA
jgi:hypothetical protein